MQSFRAHYLRHGYVLVPSAIATAASDQLGVDVYNACVARRKHLMDLPLIDNIVKQTSRVADPLYDKLEKRLKQHRRRAKLMRAQRRKRAGISALGDVSGDDVWAMTQKIAASLVGGSATGAAVVGSEHSADAVVEPTVSTDHLMLAAINKFQANAWMTNERVEEAVRGENVGAVVGRLVRDVVGCDGGAGAASPFLFSDMPVIREPFGRPLAPSFGAPHIGVGSSSLAEKACVAWVFTADHCPLRMPVYVFENSHRYVREQYCNGVDPRQFEVTFKPLESHTPQWMPAFNFGADVSPAPLGPVARGSVLLCDPHLFVGAGCNNVCSPTSVLRMAIVDGSVRKASLRPPSWIRGWRSSAGDVPLHSSVVFPRLL